MNKAAAYRKAIVAAVGLVFVVGAQFGLSVGADLEPAVVTAVDGALGLLTVLGVFQVPNDQAALPTFDRVPEG
jgi:uncharacterized membrane protein